MQTDAGDPLLAEVRTLLDLACWLGDTDGYGNLVLAYRARDVAQVGAARLIADLNYPVAQPAAQLARLTAPFDAPTVRGRVLNLELGSPLFPTGASTQDIDLKRVWANRQAKNALAALKAQQSVVSVFDQLADDSLRIEAAVR